VRTQLLATPRRTPRWKVAMPSDPPNRLAVSTAMCRSDRSSGRIIKRLSMARDSRVESTVARVSRTLAWRIRSLGSPSCTRLCETQAECNSALPGKGIDFTEGEWGCFSGLCLRHMSMPRRCHVLGVPCLSESGHLLGFAAHKST
jgi:hypothetical protein